MRSGLAAIALTALLGGCAVISPPKKQTLVYDESLATTDEAVAEARLAIDNAARHGCKAIGVGNGAGLAGDPELGGRLVTVVVLLECPTSAPVLLPATGAPSP